MIYLLCETNDNNNNNNNNTDTWLYFVEPYKLLAPTLGPPVCPVSMFVFGLDMIDDDERLTASYEMQADSHIQIIFQ